MRVTDKIRQAGKADKARDAGKKEFEFPKGSGKMHKVTIQAKIDEAEVNEMKMMDFAKIAQKVKNPEKFIEAIVDKLGKQSPEEEKALTYMYNSLKDLSNPLEEEYSEEEIKKMYSLDRGAPDPKKPHFKNIFKDDAITIPGLTERILKELRK